MPRPGQDAAVKQAVAQALTQVMTQVEKDRATLTRIGVPTGWAEQLRPGDRFAAVHAMLDALPPLHIEPTATVVAVVGPADSVHLEAYRVASDLALDALPRYVIAVPDDDGELRDLIDEHARTRQQDEAREGLASFREKRKPSWYPG